MAKKLVRKDTANKKDWFDKHVIIAGDTPQGWPDDWQEKLKDKLRQEVRNVAKGD
jgi:fructose-1-phosphate kinase PfkB-like protein